MKILNKKIKRSKSTTNNKEYKIAVKTNGVACPVCMGPCWGLGPYRANILKRNCGKKPRYKNIDRRSIKDYVVGRRSGRAADC